MQANLVLTKLRRLKLGGPVFMPHPVVLLEQLGEVCLCFYALFAFIKLYKLLFVVRCYD